MQFSKISLKDALYTASVVVSMAFAYGSLTSKVQAQADAIKAVPLLAEQVGRLSERVDSLKDAITELRKDIRKSR